MGYYSDPTAALALGSINREFSRLEKKARRLVKQVEEGKLPPEALDAAEAQYAGIYRHVLRKVVAEECRRAAEAADEP